MEVNNRPSVTTTLSYHFCFIYFGLIPSKPAHSIDKVAPNQAVVILVYDERGRRRNPGREDPLDDGTTRPAPNGRLVVLDYEDGTARQRYESGAVRISQPVVAQNTVFVTKSTHLERFSRTCTGTGNDGRRRWVKVITVLSKETAITSREPRIT